MHNFRKQSANPQFDRQSHHSFFPAETKAAVAPRSGPKPPVRHRLGRQPSDRRTSDLPWPEPGTVARFRWVRTAAYLIAILILSFVSFSFVAFAGRSTSNRSATASSVWASHIAEASRRFGVPDHWIRAVMQVESNGDKTTVSPKGAMGLMQVMPETYAELRLRYHLGSDPYEPRDNILAGTAYLREMRDRYGPAGFLAAYNAGPGRYEDYLMRGRPLPKETHDYAGTLASMIGVPALPLHLENAPATSPLPPFVAAHDTGARSTALNKSGLLSKMLLFENRQGAQATTLFAILRAAFEPTSASAHTVDMTALEPSLNRTLSAISRSGKHLPDRISNAAQSSLGPSGDALFAGRSAHAGK